MSTTTEQPNIDNHARHDLSGNANANLACNSTDSNQNLIECLLSEQQDLTAVDQFCRQVDQDAVSDTGNYTQLMPATAPEPGQQYAFHVDLDRCSGCKACVTACHSLNGLDTGETWRKVGLLIGGTATQPVQQHVTTACHHCLEPACMAACPVDAYEKDLVTGIVHHLDDQCFGCQYCTLACPYDVPQYHQQKGIVRKCDLCKDRLSVGEPPACVQACPHEAIRITIADVEQVIEDSETTDFLPAAPDSDITYPTTVYASAKSLPRNLLPANYYSTQAQHAHWPLIIMLVLTQLSVGAFVVGLILEHVLDAGTAATLRPIHVGTAAVFGLVALMSSLLHLGRPRYAYRALIGLKHSWLSREILAFGIFAALSGLYATTGFISADIQQMFQSILSWSVAISGLLGVFCSVMIYAFTQRAFWNPVATATKFLLTATVLGIATTWLTLLVLSGLSRDLIMGTLATTAGDALAQSLIAVTVIKLLFETAVFRHLLSRRTTSMKRSARLLIGELSNAMFARFACGILGGIIMPVFLITRPEQTVVTAQDPVLTIVVMTLFTACLVGESLERFLFFAAVAPQGMPGTMST